MKTLISSLIICSFLLNCGTVLVNAPTGKDVKLLSEADATTVKTTMRCWYLLYGLVSISGNSTGKVIAEKGLTNVKVKTYYGVMDYIFGLLLGGLTVSTRTVEIEGTTGK